MDSATLSPEKKRQLFIAGAVALAATIAVSVLAIAASKKDIIVTPAKSRQEAIQRTARIIDVQKESLRGLKNMSDAEWGQRQGRMMQAQQARIRQQQAEQQRARTLMEQQIRQQIAAQMAQQQKQPAAAPQLPPQSKQPAPRPKAAATPAKQAPAR